MSDIISLLSPLIAMLPFLLLVFNGKKRNLPQAERSRQCYMPLVAIVFCIVAGWLVGPIGNLIV